MAAHVATEHAATYPPAGLDRRFYAGVVDRLVSWSVVAVAGGVAHRAASDGSTMTWIGVALGVAALVLLAHSAAVGLAGVSPGKAVTGLRVVDAEAGTPIGLGRAALRVLVLAVAGLPTVGLGLAALAYTAVSDPDGGRRGWHDRLVGSVVVDLRPEPEPAVAEQEEPPRQVVNLTAMRLASGEGSTTPVAVPPRRAAATQPSEAPPAASGWLVTFDTGQSLVVNGTALVGRRPEPRAGEQVRHLVPLPSQDMSLSKTHAQLQVADEGVLVVIDRGSTNGSVLIRRGVPRQLSPGRPATLLPGDTVRFGDRSMTVARHP